MVYPLKDLEPETVDIKYLGIPNICFSLTDKDDDREPGYAEQRRERGFDNSELWSLYYTIARFVYPRLKAFRETTCGCPGCFESEEEWNKILDHMVEAFRIIIEEDSVVLGGKKAGKVEKGLRLFQQYFMDLWY